jgi:hypothetical protein
MFGPGLVAFEDVDTSVVLLDRTDRDDIQDPAVAEPTPAVGDCSSGREPALAA